MLSSPEALNGFEVTSELHHPSNETNEVSGRVLPASIGARTLGDGGMGVGDFARTSEFPNSSARLDKDRIETVSVDAERGKNHLSRLRTKIRTHRLLALFLGCSSAWNERMCGEVRSQ